MMLKEVTRLFSTLALGAGLLAGSAQVQAANDCRVIFDAGSSGTRLYIYEKVGAAWQEHEGPKVGALADPVREIRGKKWTDADAVIAEVVGTLDAVRADGPLDKGKPKWTGFDWEKACTLRSASAYATAGMRIAEQESALRAIALWGRLKNALSKRVGAGVPVQARTLTGYEEGLFAWLTLNNLGKGKDFGIIEMGGASMQVTFPCADCAEAKPVKVGNESVKIFSYSFLGLGGDEAQKTVGSPSLTNPVCEFGVGGKDATWVAKKCADTITLDKGQGLIDPYNFGPSGKGTTKKLPAQTAKVGKWFGTGAFAFYKPSDVQDCCINGASSCFLPATACFRSVYYDKLLEQIGTKNYTPSSTSWTLGAMVCDQDSCLAAAPKRECGWKEREVCLVN